MNAGADEKALWAGRRVAETLTLLHCLCALDVHFTTGQATFSRHATGAIVPNVQICVPEASQGHQINWEKSDLCHNSTMRGAQPASVSLCFFFGATAFLYCYTIMPTAIAVLQLASFSLLGLGVSLSLSLLALT